MAKRARILPEDDGAQKFASVTGAAWSPIRSYPSALALSVGDRPNGLLYAQHVDLLNNEKSRAAA